MTNQRLAVLYEHPDWFKPLLAALKRRSIIYVPLYAEELSYDPAVRSFPYPLVLNRMSPSSYLRGHAQRIFFWRFLRFLEDVGVRVTQIEIFERLGLRYPRARILSTTHPKSSKHRVALGIPAKSISDSGAMVVAEVIGIRQRKSECRTSSS
jgi:hypothetical protein